MQFYNGEQMRELRKELLDGRQPKRCNDCYYQDQHGKLSGRIKQLNKSGIMQDHFELSTRSSPHYEYFLHSQHHDGESTYQPVDLQIDLGNICNSACIMCFPVASTRLQQDYKKLHRINPVMFADSADFTTWTRDPNLLDRVVNELIAIPNLRYIHFLGGETLYDSAFYDICERMIAAGISKNVIVGITTNGTIYDSRVEQLIRNFKEFHLGISIESVTELNDYIRYPSDIEDVLANINKFLRLRDSTNLYVSLRITPNVFTISEIDKLLDYMLINNVAGESCNILTRPEFLRIELLPEEIRQETIRKLTEFIEINNVQKSNQVNMRRPDLIASAIGDLAAEYKTFLETYTVPDNVEQLREQLVEFLHGFETIRNNSIVDYAPRYEEFLSRYGY
jgi:sulfatase maturation enzyme AslB (radical SAM superfamily)